MESKKLIAIFCMVLIIGLPFSSLSVTARDSVNPYNIMGDVPNPFINEVNVGEAVIVNVDGYEPITISSDYLQNQDFPVYVFLKGMTAGSILFGDDSEEGSDPLFGGINVKRVVITPENMSLRFINGAPVHIPPQDRSYTVGADGLIDFGYMIVNLRKIKNENDLPDSIDLNMSARVYFDSDAGIGGLFGAQDLNLKPYSDESNWFEDSSAQAESSFWSGKGYIRTTSIGDDYVTVSIYDGMRRIVVSNLKLSLNSEPSSFTLPGFSSLFGEQSRINLKAINRAQDSVNLLIKTSVDSESYETTLVKGMRIFPGSEWTIYSVNSDRVVISDNTGNKRELVYGTADDIIVDPCKEFATVSDSDLADSSIPDAKIRHYCTAISEAKEALGYSLSAQPSNENTELLKGIYGSLYEYYSEIGDYGNALENLQKKESLEFTDSGQNEIGALFDSLDSAGKTIPLSGGASITLLQINEMEESASAKAKVGNSLDYVEINVHDPLIRGIREGDRTYDWVVSSLSEDRIMIRKHYSDGEWADSFSLDEGYNNVYGTSVTIKDVDTKQSALISILPGSGRAFSESNFMVHLPIEKRAIQWTPEEIDRKINSTTTTIAKLESSIDKLESLVKGWKMACLGVFTFLTVKNSFFGNPIARQLVMRDWKETCKQKYINGEYSSVDNCLDSNSQIIEDQIDNSGDAVDVVNDVMKDFKDFEDPASRSAISNAIGNDLNESQIRLLVEYGGFDLDDARNMIYLKNFNDTTYNNQLIEVGEDLNLYSEIDVGLSSITDEEAKRLYVFSKFHETSTTDLRTYGESADAWAIESLTEEYGESAVSGVYRVEEATRDTNATSGIEFYTYYNGNKKSGLSVVLDENNLPISVGGKSVFKDNNDKLYMVNRGSSFGNEYSRDFFPKPKIEYTEEGNPWIIPMKLRSGLFEHSEYANYVLVGFDSSGNPDSYQIWNVGSDGKADVYKANYEESDDILVMHESILESNPSVLGTVTRTYSTANVKVKEGKKVPGTDYVASYAASKIQETSLECMDFMSKGDCDLLFGVCDPVMCPVSRFDLGGHWKVDSVVQTGIVGSVFLGLHNFGIKEPLPVCLTGILAGLQNIKTLYQGYNECLNTAKVSGESVGICNTIRSVYVCEMLWREAIALFSVHGKILSFVSEKIFGKSDGGGEYMSWQSSWKNLENSVTFFTSDYAQSAFASYSSRSTEELGNEVCKSAIFAKAPAVGDFFSQLTQPESPPQFTAWFDELDYTSSDRVGFLDKQSLYRVYYHIYAGETQELQYTVYLKGPNLYNLIVTDPEKKMNRAYLSAGDFADKSFTVSGNSGYTEVCVEYNGMTKCGFGKTTSAFSLNYLNDMIVRDEVNRQIESADQCIPDSPRVGPSLGSLITPSNYGLLRTGIIRVCSVTDPDDSSGSDKWEVVGSCGSDEVGRSLGYCWLDSSTFQLNDVIDREEVLAQVSSDYVADISTQAGMLSTNEANVMIDNNLNTNSLSEYIHNLREIMKYSNDNYVKARGHKLISWQYFSKGLNIVGPSVVSNDLDCTIEYDFDISSVVVDPITGLVPTPKVQSSIVAHNLDFSCKFGSWTVRWNELFDSGNWRNLASLSDCGANADYADRWFSIDDDNFLEMLKCRYSLIVPLWGSQLNLFYDDKNDLPFVFNTLIPQMSHATDCNEGINLLVNLAKGGTGDDDELHVIVGNDKKTFNKGDIQDRPQKTANEIIDLCTGVTSSSSNGEDYNYDGLYGPF